MTLPLPKNIPSKFYNWMTSRMSGVKLHDHNCGIKAYRNKVVKSIEVYGEMHRYIPVIAKWAGFKKIGEKVVEHRKRKYGVTKFGMNRFVRGPLDLLSIMFVSKVWEKAYAFVWRTRNNFIYYWFCSGCYDWSTEDLLSATGDKSSFGYHKSVLLFWFNCDDNGYSAFPDGFSGRNGFPKFARQKQISDRQKNGLLKSSVLNLIKIRSKLFVYC